MSSISSIQPGPIVLFGSGETSPSGRKIFDRLLRQLPQAPRIALLETPAGFELNSTQVIGRVAEFIHHRLQNFDPQVMIIPARKRGTPFSPDNPKIVSPLLKADMIFMGPGSPTYTIRQLHDSLAWHYLVARHRLGATIVMASAAVIAVSSCALPVYEIYKVGEDLHWKEGLDLFHLYGLSLVFIPHWNNNDGGADLDTSRCFMGESRFTLLMELLPADITVVGIDEYTSLIIDPQNGICHVLGLGGVTLIHTGHLHRYHTINLEGTGLAEVAEQRNGHVHQYHTGESFPLHEIGPFRLYHPEVGLPPGVWQAVLDSQQEPSLDTVPSPPPEVFTLVEKRETARSDKNWEAADALRDQINELGWQVLDTPEGPQLHPCT